VVHQLQRSLAAVLLALLGVALLTACGDDGDPGFAERVEDPFAGGYPMYVDEASGLRIVVGTPDLGLGERRVTLALFAADGALFDQPAIDVQRYFYPDGPNREREGPLEIVTTRFSEFPFGGRGIYTGTFTFERPGLYALSVEVPMALDQVRIPLDIAAAPRAVDIGEPAPRSRHRTLTDVESIEELTTSYLPDPALYQVQIADAIEAARPFVVVFTSPAFCTTALCGPQAELLSELAAEHAGAAEFVHIDLYENPHEIQGDLDRARRTPVLDEWGVETDQWTFVVDANGHVSSRFEGFVPRDELEAALNEVAGP
jgi:hypothetical protein